MLLQAWDPDLNRGLVNVMCGDLIWRNAIKLNGPCGTVVCFSGRRPSMCVCLCVWRGGGDESQRVRRRSVCGQDKMYPVLKECLNYQSGLEQWLGQFHFITPPIGSTSSCSTHTHTHTPQAVFSSFQSHRRGNGGTSSQLKHTAAAAAAAAKTLF